MRPEHQLRRRRISPNVNSFRQSGRPSYLKSFKNLDLFPKMDTPTEKESRVRTESGGVLSICGLVIIAWLVLSQSFYFIFPETEEHLVVDTMFDKKLEIHFDITFHSIPCGMLGVDVMDVTGEQQMMVKQEVMKQRLDLDGNIIGKAVNERHGFDTILFNFMRMDRNPEGCRVTGNLHIQKVSGNFHLALGSAHEVQGKHVHQFAMADIPRFNASHTIHSLKFGPWYPNQQLPLDGKTHIIEQAGGGVFTYHIKVIPVEYHSNLGWITHSNLYGYSYKYRHIEPPRPGMRMAPSLPGVFFLYKINPYMLRITQARPTFITFIVNLSAIAGGVFAISGFFDSVTFNIQMLTKAKDVISNKIQERFSDYNQV